MPSVLDMNRPNLQAMDLDGSGRVVCMYLDNPGVYFDRSGDDCTEEDAAQAGFDVEHWRKARVLKQKVDAAKAEAAADEFDADAARSERVSRRSRRRAEPSGEQAPEAAEG